MFRLRLFGIMGFIVFCMIPLAFASPPPPHSPSPSPTPQFTPTPTPTLTPTPTSMYIIDAYTIDILDMWDIPSPTVQTQLPVPSPSPLISFISVEGTALFILLVSLVGVCIAGILLGIRDGLKNQNPL